MFCTKCGSEIPDGSAFCTECGAPADSTPGSSPAPAAKGNPAIESAPKGSGRPFPLSDWFSFRGRMARKEWWIRTLILLFFWSPVPIALLAAVFSESEIWAPQEITGILWLAWLSLSSLAGAVSLLSVAVRRVHDYNTAGGWFVVFLIPFFSKYGSEDIVLWTWLVSLVIVFLALGFHKGTAGENRFGPDPLV